MGFRHKHLYGNTLAKTNGPAPEKNGKSAIQKSDRGVGSLLSRRTTGYPLGSQIRKESWVLLGCLLTGARWCCVRAPAEA